MVELRHVSKRFGGKQVLDDVSLVVGPRERLVIIGQSGAGKTTILRLILGILKPNKGSVFFNQHEASQMNDHELEAVRMRMMGMVYQDAALLSSLTVRENLALPLQELTNKTPAEIDKLVDENAIVYVAVTGTVLYSAVHEGFGIKILLWNCIPPTLGLLAILSPSTRQDRAGSPQLPLRALLQL